MLPTILISPITSQGLETKTVYFCFVSAEDSKQREAEYPICRLSEA